MLGRQTPAVEVSTAHLERLEDRPPQTPAGAAEDVALLAPLREELAQRVRVEARLRAELAALRARVDTPGPARERLEAVRRELADELVRVRQVVDAHEQRRAECDALRARVGELEVEVIDVRQEVGALRTAELSARGGREAALAEVGALRDELERLAAGESAAEANAGERELERAEALLAEARALTESIG